MTKDNDRMLGNIIGRFDSLVHGNKPVDKGNVDNEDFRTKVESPALTTSLLYQGAHTLVEKNKDMSPTDRAKYFRQMAERVAKELEADNIR